MENRQIRLALAEPAGEPEGAFPVFRGFVEKTRDDLAKGGWDLRVSVWSGCGQDRVLKRLTRACPEVLAQADLCFFLFREEGDTLLQAEYETVSSLAAAGSGPRCARFTGDGRGACRALLEALLELEPFLPVRPEDGLAPAAGEENPEADRPSGRPDLWSLLTRSVSLTCRFCGGELTRYDDWYICDRCHRIG